MPDGEGTMAVYQPVALCFEASIAAGFAAAPNRGVGAFLMASS